MFRHYKQPLVIEPMGEKATASVICIHGLGASGYDFEDLIPEFQRQLKQPVRFVMPHALELAVTVNRGYSIPAWYDIANPDLSRDHDEEGILSSVSYIHYLIQEEIKKGIPAARIIVAGFSQGGVMSLTAALSFNQSLGGCLVMSSYLAETEKLLAQFQEANQALPILWLHGRYDSIVPYVNAEQAVSRLQSFGYSVELKNYPVAHIISPKAIPDILAYIAQRLDHAA